jgi:hypothetical protein
MNHSKVQLDFETFLPFLSGPLSYGLSNNKDPFCSLPRPLLSAEYSLLNHCM